MMDSSKRVSQITIQYSDESQETVDKGLVAYMPDAESVLIQTKELDVPTLLTLLAALEEAAKRYLMD